MAARRRGGGEFAAPEHSTSESGFGDVLKASYVVLEKKGFIPETAPYACRAVPRAYPVGATTEAFSRTGMRCGPLLGFLYWWN